MFDLLLIDVSGMSLFPFDIAKIRQYSEQNKLFADFRRDYMRHGSQFVTRNQGGGVKTRCKVTLFSQNAITFGKKSANHLDGCGEILNFAP